MLSSPPATGRIVLILNRRTDLQTASLISLAPIADFNVFISHAFFVILITTIRSYACRHGICSFFRKNLYYFCISIIYTQFALRAICYHQSYELLNVISFHSRLLVTHRNSQSCLTSAVGCCLFLLFIRVFCCFFCFFL